MTGALFVLVAGRPTGSVELVRMFQRIPARDGFVILSCLAQTGGRRDAGDR